MFRIVGKIIDNEQNKNIVGYRLCDDRTGAIGSYTLQEAFKALNADTVGIRPVANPQERVKSCDYPDPYVIYTDGAESKLPVFTTQGTCVKNPSKIIILSLYVVNSITYYNVVRDGKPYTMTMQQVFDEYKRAIDNGQDTPFFNVTIDYDNKVIKSRNADESIPNVTEKKVKSLADSMQAKPVEEKPKPVESQAKVEQSKQLVKQESKPQPKEQKPDSSEYEIKVKKELLLYIENCLGLKVINPCTRYTHWTRYTDKQLEAIETFLKLYPFPTTEFVKFTSGPCANIEGTDAFNKTITDFEESKLGYKAYGYVYKEHTMKEYSRIKHLDKICKNVGKYFFSKHTSYEADGNLFSILEHSRGFYRGTFEKFYMNFIIFVREIVIMHFPELMPNIVAILTCKTDFVDKNALMNCAILYTFYSVYSSCVDVYRFFISKNELGRPSHADFNINIGDPLNSCMPLYKHVRVNAVTKVGLILPYYCDYKSNASSVVEYYNKPYLYIKPVVYAKGKALSFARFDNLFMYFYSVARLVKNLDYSFLPFYPAYNTKDTEFKLFMSDFERAFKDGNINYINPNSLKDLNYLAKWCSYKSRLVRNASLLADISEFAASKDFYRFMGLCIEPSTEPLVDDETIEIKKGYAYTKTDDILSDRDITTSFPCVVNNYEELKALTSNYIKQNNLEYIQYWHFRRILAYIFNFDPVTHTEEEYETYYNKFYKYAMKYGIRKLSDASYATERMEYLRWNLYAHGSRTNEPILSCELNRHTLEGPYCRFYKKAAPEVLEDTAKFAAYFSLCMGHLPNLAEYLNAITAHVTKKYRVRIETILGIMQLSPTSIKFENEDFNKILKLILSDAENFSKVYNEYMYGKFVTRSYYALVKPLDTREIRKKWHGWWKATNEKAASFDVLFSYKLDDYDTSTPLSSLIDLVLTEQAAIMGY